MATNDVQDPTTGTGDWWSQNAPPTTAAPPTGARITSWDDPRLLDVRLANDPAVIDWVNRTTPGTGQYDPTLPPNPGKGQQGGSGGRLTGPETPNPGPGTPVLPPGVPTSGFGAAPTPYASNPDAPTYDPLPPYVAPQWTGGDYVAPTEAELLASPGYQGRLDAVLRARNRSAAAQGTILNPGTLVALGRDAQTFASGEYQNLRANTLEAYKQRYSQFTDAAGRDLASRTVNANDNQNTFANRTLTYNGGNARTLSDYITNVTNKRNSELDYWNRLQDLNKTGADLSGGSR